MDKAQKIQLARELRIRFIAAGHAGGNHEPWEQIGERQKKWIRLIDLADELLRGVHARERQITPPAAPRRKRPR